MKVKFPRVGATPLVRTKLVGQGPITMVETDDFKEYMGCERAACLYELPRWMRVWKPEETEHERTRERHRRLRKRWDIMRKEEMNAVYYPYGQVPETKLVPDTLDGDSVLRRLSLPE